jgi:hypothetical protein
MLAALVEEKRLSADQVARLKEILDGREGTAKPRRPQ